MLVRFTRGHNAETMTCTRLDGSTEIFRRAGDRRGFFVLHDLLHLAVESVLGYRQAFFGLIASGHKVADFERRGAAATLPLEAHWAEHLVGAIQVHLSGNALPPASDLVAGIRPHFAGRDPPALTQHQLDAIAAAYSALVTRWRALPEGQPLELAFPLLPSTSSPPRRSSS